MQDLSPRREMKRKRRQQQVEGVEEGAHVKQPQPEGVEEGAHVEQPQPEVVEKGSTHVEQPQPEGVKEAAHVKPPPHEKHNQETEEDADVGGEADEEGDGDEEEGTEEDGDNSEEDGEAEGNETRRVKKKLGRPRLDVNVDLPRDCRPTNSSLLYLFSDHVATYIWNNVDRPALKCHNHFASIKKWTLPLQSHATFWRLLKQSGLYGLASLTHRSIDKAFISALVERWYPETNTFHLPFGEMTITLDDVSAILGLSVKGHAVDQTQASAQMEGLGWRDVLEEEDGQLKIDTLEKVTQMCTEYIGIAREEITAEITRNRKFEVRIGWLRKKLPQLRDLQYDDEYQHQYLRGYLLYLLGCTIFGSKAGDKVSLRYLLPLSDVKTIHEYSWASATLAFLYRQLGLASRPVCKQVAGCLTLLQAWGYEHFPKFRKGINSSYENTKPRAMRWNPNRFDSNVEEAKTLARAQLDHLLAHEVDWTPYKESRQKFRVPAFQPYAYYRGCIKCFDIVEPYLPDRVLRQFGHMQSIPRDPIEPISGIKLRERIKNYQKHRKFEWIKEIWADCGAHCLIEIRRGRKATIPYETAQDYMTWFEQRAHLKVINPEFQALGGMIEDPRDKRIARIKDVLDKVYDAGKEAGLDVIFEALVKARNIAHGRDNDIAEPRAARSTTTRARTTLTNDTARRPKVRGDEQLLTELPTTKRGRGRKR